MGLFDWFSDPWPEEPWWRRRTFRFNDDAADARADANIGAQMLWGHERRRAEVPEAAHPPDETVRHRRPDDRPHDRAQWDEVQGRWVEWDHVDDEWDPVEAHDVEPGGDVQPDTGRG